MPTAQMIRQISNAARQQRDIEQVSGVRQRDLVQRGIALKMTRPLRYPNIGTLIATTQAGNSVHSM